MSLFSKLKNADTFGKFGNKFAKYSDSELMSLYKSGEADALAEFANRHPEIIQSQAWRTAKRLGNAPEDNLGDMWLSMDRSARNFKEDAGASPSTYIGGNLMNRGKERQVKQIEELEKQPNYDNINIQDNKDFDSGADMFDANKDIADKEAHIKEMKDMVAKLEAELAKTKLGKDKTGTDMVNAYKVADWKNAGKDNEKMNAGFARVDSGKDASFQPSYAKQSNVSDQDMANELGLGRETFVAQKKSMLDRLPPKLKAEILASLRGRAK